VLHYDNGNEAEAQPKRYKDLGRVLADARDLAGHTQSELAKRLKKPQSFVSSYERGQRRVDLMEFGRIADALGVNRTKLYAKISNLSVF
jgi:transcriptional regulator with XRE-family HTH domain